MPATTPDILTTNTLAPDIAPEQDPYSLTDTEIDIWTRTTLGESIGEIACALSAGIHEIYSMRRGIAWQFGTVSVNAATNRSIQRGIIPIEFDSEPTESNEDERKFLRLMASGRDYRHVGHHFNYAKPETIAFLATHMAVKLDAKVEVENEENSNLIRRAHEAGLIV